MAKVMLEIPKAVNQMVTRVANRHNVCFGLMFKHALELLLVGLEYQRARTPLVWERIRDTALIDFLPAVMISGEVTDTLQAVTVTDSIQNLIEPFIKNERLLRQGFVRAASVLCRAEAYHRTSRLMKCKCGVTLNNMRVPVDTKILPKFFQAQ